MTSSSKDLHKLSEILAANPGIDSKVVEEAERLSKAVELLFPSTKSSYNLLLPFSQPLIHQPTVQNVLKKNPA